MHELERLKNQIDKNFLLWTKRALGFTKILIKLYV